MRTKFKDRREAGRAPAGELKIYAKSPAGLVLACERQRQRPVDFELARALALPLDVLVVRNPGVPGREDLAFGALAPGGVGFFDRATIDALGLTPAQIEGVVERERRELERRETLYRAGRTARAVRGQTVILADDGLAAGVCCVCALTPDPFYAVGLWYRDFPQVDDDAVRELLARSETGRQHGA